MLPYWNWSEELQIPAPFRVPTSPLFDGSRVLNNGSSIDPTITVDSLRIALSSTSFYDPPRPAFSNLHEGRPHGAVHLAIGGNMFDPGTAARDPIFWLHHANVDRIWDQWLNQSGGRENPSDSAFLDQTFEFADETGNRRTVAVRDILDSRTLNYRYDDVPNPPASRVLRTVVSAGTPPHAAHEDHAEMMTEEPSVVVAAPVERHRAAPQQPDAELVEELPTPKPLTLKAERVELAPIAGRVAAIHAAAESAGGGLYVEVQGIQLQRAPEFNYGVYLNLPAEITDPAQARPYFLGTLDLFGAGAEAAATHAALHGGDGHAAALNDFNQSFDASAVIENLQRANRWREDSFSVTLLPLPPIAPPNLREATNARLAASLEAAAIKYRSVVLKTAP